MRISNGKKEEEESKNKEFRPNGAGVLGVASWHSASLVTRVSSLAPHKLGMMVLDYNFLHL